MSSGSGASFLMTTAGEDVLEEAEGDEQLDAESMTCSPDARQFTTDLNLKAEVLNHGDVRAWDLGCRAGVQTES